jgi:hypothetical protein
VIGAEQEPAAFQPVEILPGRMHLRLETSGGILGLRNLTEVFKPGIVRVTRSRTPSSAPRHLRPEEQELLTDLFASLPEDPRSALTTFGSDFFQYRLGWWAGDRWREVVVDDGTAKDALARMIEFLARL